jgi:hypothetical protein
MTDEVEPYEERHDPAYNDFAASTARVRILPDERNPEEIIIEGPCASCHHESAFHEPLVAYRDANWAPIRHRLFDRMILDAAAALKKRVVTVYCRCGRHHPGTPPMGGGCGAYWKLTVEWGSDG